MMFLLALNAHQSVNVTKMSQFPDSLKMCHVVTFTFKQEH